MKDFYVSHCWLVIFYAMFFTDVLRNARQCPVLRDSDKVTTYLYNICTHLTSDDPKERSSIYHLWEHVFSKSNKTNAPQFIKS